MLKFGIAGFVVWFGLVIAIGIGYVSNIVKLIDCDFKPSYKCEIIRVVGLVPVVGMITGYMSNEKLGEPAKQK